MNTKQDSLFGEIRQMLQAPLSSGHELLPILVQYHQLDSRQYHDEVLPYVSAFALPEFVIKSVHQANILPPHSQVTLDWSDRNTSQEQMAEFCEHLTHHNIHNCRLVIDDAGFSILIECKHLTANLSNLNIWASQLTMASIERLVEHNQLPKLTSLNIGHHKHFGSTVAQHLSSSHLMTQLKHLGLAYCNLGNQGAISLAKPAWTSSLKQLDLRGNDIWGPGIRAIADTTMLPHLNHINLEDNRLDEHDIMPLKHTTAFKLKHLII